MTETNENKGSCENLCNLVVRKRKMLKDERGQMSIDFLVGISLFILALLFMAHFIPGMFVPFQTETIDLNSVAYRTSVILVEDPGWWDDVSDNGEDWENQDIAKVRRVGLAIDKEHPNLLKWSKIKGFENCGADLTRKLGLYRMIGGNPINYGYNITIVNASKNILAARGDSVPEYGDVSSMERMVWTHTGWAAVVSNVSLEGAKSSNKALFYINKSDVETILLMGDININITDFVFTLLPQKTYCGIKLANEVHHTVGSGYHIDNAVHYVEDDGGYASLLNNVTDCYEGCEEDVLSPTSCWTITNKTDTLKIFMANSLFVNLSDQGKLNLNGSEDVYIELDFGNGINVTADHTPPAGSPFISFLDAVYEQMGLIIKVW